MREKFLADEFFKRKASVVSAEAERISNCGVDGASLRDVRNVI